MAARSSGMDLNDPLLVTTCEDAFREKEVKELKDAVRVLKDENGRLNKLLGERDEEMRILCKARDGEKRALAGTGVAADIAAGGIMELSKRRRELTFISDLQSEWNKVHLLSKKTQEMESKGYPLPGFAFPSRHYGGVQQQLPTMGPQEQPSHFHSMNTGPVMQQDIDMVFQQQQYPQQPPGYGNGNGNYQGYNGGYQGPGPVSPQTPTQPMASYQGSYQAEHGYPEAPSANQAMAEFGFEAGPHQSMGITRPASLSLANLSAMSNWQHYYPDGFGVNRPVSPVHKQMQPSRVPYSQQAQSYQSSSYPKKSSSSPGKNQMQGYNTGSSCAPRSSTGMQMPGLLTTAYQPPHSPIMQPVTTSVPQQDGGLYGMPHEALTEPQPPFGPSQEQFQQQLQHPHSSCMFVQLGTMPSHLQYQPQQNVTGERTERSKECEELNREDKSLSEKAKGNCSDTSVEVKEVPTVHFQEGAKPQMTGGNPDKTVSDQKKRPPVLLRSEEHLCSDSDERLSVPQLTTCLPPVISKRKGIQTVEQPTITPGTAHYHVTSLKAPSIDKGTSLLNNQQAIVADTTTDQTYFVKGLIVPEQLPKPQSAELIKANSKLIMVNPEKMGAEATKQPHTTTKSSEGKAKSKSDSSKTTDNEKLTKERIALVGNEAGVEKIVHMDASGNLKNEPKKILGDVGVSRRI